MIDYGIYFLCNFFLLLIVQQFIIDFMGRTHNKKHEVCAFMFFYIFTFLVNFYIGIPIINFFANVIGIFLITLSHNGTLRKRILLSVLIPMINASCDMVTYFIVSIRLGNLYGDNFSFIFTVLLVWICERMITCLNINTENIPVSKKYIFFLLSIPICGLVIIYCVTIANMEKYGAIMGVCVLLINLITFYLYSTVIENEWNRIQNKLLEKSIKSYENELNIMGESQRRIQSVRHDIRHHLIELKALTQTNSNIDLARYLKNIENSLELDREIVYSGSYEVDSLLNYLLSSAKKELKNVNVKMCMPQDIRLDKYRFNIIVGNLLENAIEAAKCSDEQYLDIKLMVERGILKLNVSNSFTGELRKNGDQLISKKKEKEKHGIGIENVKNIVYAQNGDMKIWVDNKIFHVNVMLYLSEKY